MTLRPVFGPERKPLDHPITTRLLDRLWPDEALIEAPKGPRPCCADFARVVTCAEGLDGWMCPVCSTQWTAVCR